MLQGLNKFLRIMIIILLILLAVLSVYYKYGNCDVCKFEYEGENIDVEEFMEIYKDKCFSGPSLSDFNMSV